MPKIVAAGTAVPPHAVDQSSTRDFARAQFSSYTPDIERLLSIFDTTGVVRRYFSFPLDWLAADHSPDDKRQLYMQSAVTLSAAAGRRALDLANVSTQEIDAILYATSAAPTDPGIDALLINQLNLRRDVKPTLLPDHGGAGGPIGLSQAHHYLLGHPTEKVLLLATEVGGMAFRPDDISESNLRTWALIGEGSAAVLLVGDKVDSNGLEIVSTQSSTLPDSQAVRRRSPYSREFAAVIDRNIARLVADNSTAELDVLLAQNGLNREQLTEYIYHPVSLPFLDAYEEALEVTDGGLRRSRRILRMFGNLSAATVLFVLAGYLADQPTNRKGYGVISALGPGLCSESLLVRCSP